MQAELDEMFASVRAMEDSYNNLVNDANTGPTDSHLGTRKIRRTSFPEVQHDEVGDHNRHQGNAGHPFQLEGTDSRKEDDLWKYLHKKARGENFIINGGHIFQNDLHNKAQSRYALFMPQGLTTTEKFDLMKSKCDAQVKALKQKCYKKECIFDDGEPGESPFT